ncbi:ferredoxin [Actinomadura barringtoniae]|uniref:Ferredoxin n=1 Tax=Actinomadura barringtoniae TaxID=1427535 RepID=A0A939T368_9ACTN|nr:ferredoxin [Actinomadura barringtoniae]MBO2447668.1 ferredoxin [Actinomadura barringtoniae]
MKADVDDDRCRGHGICCTLCPEVFELTGDGYTVVREAEIPAEFEQAVRAAAAQCPERAITLG